METKPNYLLTAANYQKGFLIDSELMGGVTDLKDSKEAKFAAYVLRHTTGEYLGYQEFKKLGDALGSINRVERSWSYQSSSGCGEANCGNKTCDNCGACSN